MPQIIFVPSAPVVWLYATRPVPLVHFVQPFAEPAFRHGHFNDVREVAFDCVVLDRPL